MLGTVFFLLCIVFGMLIGVVSGAKKKLVRKLFYATALIWMLIIFWNVYSLYDYLMSKMEFLEVINAGLENPYILGKMIKQSELVNFLEIKRMLGFIIYQLFQRIIIVPNQPHVFIDTSTDLESSLIYTDSLGLPNIPYLPLAIDIGAADGLLGSNSFLFYQMGTPVVMVEPDPLNARTIKSNYIFTDSKRHLLLRWAIGEEDGVAKLFLGADKTHTSNSLKKGLTSRVSEKAIEVQSATYATLIKRAYEWLEEPSSPDSQFFLMISIDAEGMEDIILTQINRSKTKPIYIIYEDARFAERGVDLLVQLTEYIEFGKAGPNRILKHKNFV